MNILNIGPNFKRENIKEKSGNSIKKSIIQVKKAIEMTETIKRIGPNPIGEERTT